jgi:hypothetical protein
VDAGSIPAASITVSKPHPVSCGCTEGVIVPQVVGGSMIAEGRNNQAIARELELSVKTVRNYVSMIFNKLQVADRAEAMLKAHAAGLGRNQA